MAEWGTTDSWLTSHCHGGSRKGVEVRLWKARVRTAFWGAGMGKRAGRELLVLLALSSTLSFTAHSLAHGPQMACLVAYLQGTGLFMVPT